MTDLPAVRRVALPREARAMSAAATDPVIDRLRRPIHIGALLGVSAGLYATSLTGVAILQQRADDSLAAARAPAVAQIDELRAMNRRLADAVNTLSKQDRSAGAGYDTLRSQVDAAEATLTDLARVVGDVRGAAAALPERIALPAVPRAAAVHAASAPAHATSGGSGK
jgi:hypothetical protein